MVPVVRVAELSDFLSGAGLCLTESGAPETSLAFVELDGATSDISESLALALSESPVVLIGLATQPLPQAMDPILDSLSYTLVRGGRDLPATQIAVEDLPSARTIIENAVTQAPRAAMTLRGLLQLTSQLPVGQGLAAESLAYSMLLSGPEFARWRASRPNRGHVPISEPAVLLDRAGSLLTVTLNRPDRHNAFDRELRDGLVDAFDLVNHDPTIEHVEVGGAGASFSSGGDLDEFGCSRDPATAHLIRLDRSVAVRLNACRDRVHVVVQGACIGAGIEISSFAARLSAHDDAFFQLPELAMGLIPGAGGSVGIARRIGRWRTAYLALTGARLDVRTALEWGLVDDRVSR
jgi:hypothetical protein